MKEKSSKTRILVAIAAAFLVVAVALVIIIIKINKEDSSTDTGKSLTESELMTQADNNNVSDSSTTDVTSNSNGNEADEGTLNQDSSLKGDTSVDDKQSLESDTKKEDKPKTHITVTLGNYKGLSAVYEPLIITDDMVQDSLLELQDEYTEVVALPDRVFEQGDMAIVTFEGKVDGETIDALYGVCLQVVIGSGIMPKKIEDEIIGKRKGDKFVVDIDYPETFTQVPEAAGKTVSFDIDLVDGFAFDIPEINDALVKKATDYTSLVEYKNEYKSTHQAEENQKAYDAAIDTIKRQVVDGCQYSDGIDDEVKMAYVLRINEENDEAYQNYWMDAATYNEIYNDIPAEEYQKKVMDEETYRVKYEYALEEIAKQEGLSIEEADKLVIESAVIEGLEN